MPTVNFKRPPSNEQTLLTELGQVTAQRDALAVTARSMIHAGMGSDLMALCGKVSGCAGHDQVILSYVAAQVTCPDCLKAQRDKLQAFKDWCHSYLDTHGVPKEFPDGPHSREGCRIGDRMDWLMARCEAAEFNCSVAQKGWQQTLDDLMKVVDGFNTAQEQIRRLRESLWNMLNGPIPAEADKARAVLKETSP